MSAALIHSSVTCIYSRTDVVMSDLLFFFVYRYKYMFIYYMYIYIYIYAIT